MPETKSHGKDHPYMTDIYRDNRRMSDDLGIESPATGGQSYPSIGNQGDHRAYLTPKAQNRVTHPRAAEVRAAKLSKRNGTAQSTCQKHREGTQDPRVQERRSKVSKSRSTH